MSVGIKLFLKILNLSKTILRCSDPNRNLIFLPKEGYCFAGSFRFQCLFGEVTVGGYTAKGQTFSEDNFMQFTVHNKAQLPVRYCKLRVI